jgi:hypothetical protein
MEKLDITKWNNDTNAYDVLTTVDCYDLGKDIRTPEKMAEILEGRMNTMGADYQFGIKTGAIVQTKHRTLQSCIYRFCLGLIVGLSRQEYTDARNEVAVRNGKKIESMIEDGTLEIGWMI